MSAYRAYLKSQQWAELRERALYVHGGLCVFCGESATNVHHVAYPKQFHNDSIFNLQPLCRRCHMKTHAIVDIPALGSCDIEKFEGQPFIVSRKVKFIGRTADGWMHVYNVPDFAKPRGRALIEDELIQILKANDSLGIRKQLVATCDLVKDQRPLFAFRIARRAMYALSNELKAASQDRNAPKIRREAMLQFWGEVFRTEDRMADWVDSTYSEKPCLFVILYTRQAQAQKRLGIFERWFRNRS